MKRLLIIHTAFIGDIVLSTPLLKKIKDLYGDVEITYLTTPIGAEVLKNNPNISEIIVYDKKALHSGIKGVIQLGKRLRYKNFNLVINLHRYLRSGILTFLTRAPLSIGYDIGLAKFIYTKKIKYDKQLHEVERILSFLPENPEKRDVEYNIELFPSKQDENRVKELLTTEDLQETREKKIVVLAPGSKWFTKKWPVEYWNELSKKLSYNKNIQQIIVGGEEEKNIAMEISENCLDLRGKTTLLELAVVIKKAKIIVSNDSSPIHIASAFKDTFIIAIFGPTVKKIGFFPWSKNSIVLEQINLKCRPCEIHGGNKCPKKHFKCMLETKPEKVFEMISTKL
jgi:heptosyltransferase-2